MKDAMIGHNNPPAYDPDVLASCQTKVEDFTGAAKAWLDLKVIETKDQAEKASDFVSGARAVWKEIDGARKTAKKIHDDAGKSVQEAFSPLLDKIKTSVDKIALMQADWLKKENARIAEEKALAAKEAEAKRLEAERLAAEAEANNDVSAMVDAEKMLKEAAKEEKAAAKPAKASAGSATGGGRTMSLRKSYACKLENINHAFMAFRDAPEVAEVLVRLANAAVRAQKGDKRAPAGFLLVEHEGAA